MRAPWEGGVANAGLEAVKVEVDDGSGEKSEKLAEDETAYDGDAEGAAEFGADTMAES